MFSLAIIFREFLIKSKRTILIEQHALSGTRFSGILYRMVCLFYEYIFLFVPKDNYSFLDCMQLYARIRFTMFWLVNSSLTIRQLWINELLYTKEKTVNRFVCSCVNLTDRVLRTCEEIKYYDQAIVYDPYICNNFIDSIFQFQIFIVVVLKRIYIWLEREFIWM